MATRFPSMMTCPRCGRPWQYPGLCTECHPDPLALPDDCNVAGWHDISAAAGVVPRTFRRWVYEGIAHVWWLEGYPRVTTDTTSATAASDNARDRDRRRTQARTDPTSSSGGIR